MHLEVGVFALEAEHDGEHAHVAEHARSGHTQETLGPRVVVLDFALHRADVLENAPRAREITPSHVGELHRSRRPLDEPCAQVILQARDELAHAGWLEPEARRARGERARLDQHDQRDHPSQRSGALVD